MNEDFGITLDQSTLKRIVEFSNKIYQNIDESFFKTMADLLSDVCERLKNIEIDNSIENHNSNQFSESEVEPFDIVEEFYRNLKPVLGDMARTQLRQSNVYVTENSMDDKDLQFAKERKKNTHLYAASYDELPVEKSWISVITNAHEIAHRFIVNDWRSLIPENMTMHYFGEDVPSVLSTRNWVKTQMPGNITEYLLEETSAEFAELLCKDYIEEKYGIKEESLIQYRLKCITEYSKNLEISEIELFKLLGEYIHLLHTEKLDDTNIKKYKKVLIDIVDKYEETISNMYGLDRNRMKKYGTFLRASEALNFRGFEYHYIGYLFANYLHEISLGNKEKQVEIFESMLNGLSIISVFSETGEDKNQTFIDSEKEELSTDGEKMAIDFKKYVNNFPRPIGSYVGSDNIKYIEKTGLPIIKDGMLKMDSIGKNAILNALDKVLQRNQTFEQTRSLTTQDNNNPKITIRECVQAAITGVTLDDIKQIENRDLNKSEEEELGDG